GVGGVDYLMIGHKAFTKIPQQIALGLAMQAQSWFIKQQYELTLMTLLHLGKESQKRQEPHKPSTAVVKRHRDLVQLIVDARPKDVTIVERRRVAWLCRIKPKLDLQKLVLAPIAEDLAGDLVGSSLELGNEAFKLLYRCDFLKFC